jgi:type I restriction enzyme S subunit
MSPERLLKHFEQISEAPNAVPCLRRFILDLAVRGKLVKQDPNDEPAADLLKRIEAGRARLISNGKVRKPRHLPPNYKRRGAIPAASHMAMGEIGRYPGI